MRKEFNKILSLTGGSQRSSILEKVLSEEEYLIESRILDSERDFLRIFRETNPQLIFADLSVLSKNVKMEDVVLQLKKEDNTIPLILSVEEEDESTALELLNLGATDYLFNDRPKKLAFLVKKHLNHQERKFKILVENNSDATLILSPNGITTYASPAVFRVLGYTQEEIKALDLYDLLNTSEKEKVLEAMSNVLELPGNSGQSFEIYAFNKSGEKICLEVTFTNLLHINDVHGVAINLRDITEYKLAEQAIVESEERYRSFFMNSMDGVLVTVTDGRILAANPAACRIFQMTEKEICELGRFGLVDVSDPRVMKALEERQLKGKVTAEITMKRKDGTFFPGELTSSVYLDANGEERTSMIIRDLSEKKEIEKEKEVVLQRYKLVSKATSDAIYDWDCISGEIFWGDGYETLFGHPGDISDIHDWENKLYAEDKKRVVEELNSALNGNSDSWKAEYRYVKADGNFSHVLELGKIIRDDEGKAVRMVGALQDITERKEADLQLLELNRNLEKYTVELINANKGLEQYSFIVSHNLRAPVANLLGLKDLYVQNDHPEEIRQRFLSELFSNIDRLDKIITDLNSILKSKTEISDKKELVNFQELVNCVADSINHLIIKEKVEIITDFSEATNWVTVRGYLHSVFYNLIFNSIKYRKPDQNPKIEIRSWKENEKVFMSFKDNGLGIDLENKSDQLFRLYKRFHHHVEGKGMGLFMVKTQVEMLGGEISVFSEINKGTEFILSFSDSTKHTEIENEGAEAVFSG